MLGSLSLNAKGGGALQRTFSRLVVGGADTFDQRVNNFDPNIGGIIDAPVDSRYDSGNWNWEIPAPCWKHWLSNGRCTAL